MDKAGSKPQQDQVQAIYLAQANIFSYEARKSAKSWVPLCDSTVPISILYDNTRSIYRIISVDADIKEVVVNTTVIPELEFVKTTQKFGYWKEPASGRVFGIGFASEYEAEAFDECLRKVKQNIGPPSVNSSVSLTQPQSETGMGGSEDQNKQGLSSSFQGQSTRLPLQQDLPSLQGQGDGPNPFQQTIKSSMPVPSPSTLKKLNWDDYEQIAPTVFSFLQQQQSNRQQQQQHPHCDQRPSTYKVDLPIISSPSVTNTAIPQTAPPHIAPAYMNHHQPFPFPFFREGPMNPAVTPAPSALMSLPMSLAHHGYCYQGPPQRSLPTGNGPSAEADASKSGRSNADAISTDRRDLTEEINRLRNENVKLSQSLIESTCAAKKWEVQANSVRDDNIQLVKSVADLNTKLESFTKEVRDYKEQAYRWKDHYQQAVSSVKEKGQHLKETEDKLKQAATDKSRIESVLKDLEEELKRQQQINKEQQNANNGHVVAGQYTNKYFKELEEHYRKLLSDSQKKIEEILRKDGDRKNVLRGVDTLFTGAIQGLINIHGQIRQAYEH